MSIFSKIQLKRPGLNKFNLSHERKFSMTMGTLTPIYVQDVVPGDRFRVRTEMLMRLAPMLAPMMHRVDAFIHYFFVPNRLVWNEWESFITGGPDGEDAPVFPYISYNMANWATGLIDVGTLWDYLGLPANGEPVLDSDPLHVSALPFRAYQMIYNEYYRDQNLSNPIAFGLGSGSANADFEELCTLRNRAWEKDYFTSALPFAQRGPAVSIPIEGQGSVTYMPNSQVIKTVGGGDPLADTDLETGPVDSKQLQVNDENVRIENIDEVIVDNINTTINDLRRAIRLQEWLEKSARGGSRYIEQILSHFGVRSSDSRLQRPEYLGGGKQPIVVSEVLSTFQQEAEGVPQGNMSGHGISTGGGSRFKRRFEEHGYVIGILSVRPRTCYQQGVPRHFTKFDKFDHYWPSFAHIGEQEIVSRELFYDPNGSAGQQNTLFGYTPRYAEYKFMPSTVHGEFKTTLSYWHMGRIFGTPPNLNENFVTCDPTSRVFAVTDAEQLYVQLYNAVDALRPMPYFGTPAI